MAFNASAACAAEPSWIRLIHVLMLQALFQTIMGHQNERKKNGRQATIERDETFAIDTSTAKRALTR
jgi:hypothetical protein